MTISRAWEKANYFYKTPWEVVAKAKAGTKLTSRNVSVTFLFLSHAIDADYCDVS